MACSLHFLPVFLSLAVCFYLADKLRRKITRWNYASGNPHSVFQTDEVVISFAFELAIVGSVPRDETDLEANVHQTLSTVRKGGSRFSSHNNPKIVQKYQI
jgi:hypothetical protein